MIDITKQSHEELSLIVMNTEKLYKMGLETPRELAKFVNSNYKHTFRQYEVMANNIVLENIRLEREKDPFYGMVK